MIRQLLIVDRNKWAVYICYGTNKNNLDEIINDLISLGCPMRDAENAALTVSNQLNTGLTFTNLEERVSYVCISNVTSVSQMVNTISHEIKHLQSHICEYYDVSESSEQAAYLIGYITMNIYKFLSKLNIIP